MPSALHPTAAQFGEQVAFPIGELIVDPPLPLIPFDTPDIVGFNNPLDVTDPPDTIDPPDEVDAPDAADPPDVADPPDAIDPPDEVDPPDVVDPPGVVDPPDEVDPPDAVAIVDFVVMATEVVIGLDVVVKIKSHVLFPLSMKPAAQLSHLSAPLRRHELQLAAQGAQELFDVIPNPLSQRKH